jgi:hypothetical protein
MGYPKELIAVIDGEEVFEIFKKSIICESCGKKGAYVIDEDRIGVGLCYNDLKKSFKIIKTKSEKSQR